MPSVGMQSPVRPTSAPRVAAEVAPASILTHASEIRGWLCLPWSEDARTTWLYRLYAIDGELLYIGISGHLGPRLNLHRTRKPWWSEVDHIITVAAGQEHEALAIERAAIRAEMPKYNRRSKPGACVAAVA